MVDLHNLIDEESEKKVSYCDLLVDRYQNALLWKNLWSGIVFFIGVALMFTIIQLLFSIGNTQLIEKANKSLAILVEGVALTWITAQRSKVVKELEEIDAKLKESLKMDTQGKREPSRTLSIDAPDEMPAWGQRYVEVKDKYDKFF
jgi:hypothetical protein